MATGGWCRPSGLEYGPLVAESTRSGVEVDLFAVQPFVDASTSRSAACSDGFAVPRTGREPGWRADGGELARQGAHAAAQPAANPWAWEGRCGPRAGGGRLAGVRRWALGLAGLAALGALAAGCGAPPCVGSVACGEGLVCGLDGRCGPLDEPEGARFAGSRWLAARDWGMSTASRRPLDDAMVLGAGGGEALLAFGPLPGRSAILRALLVLHPLDPDERVARPGELAVEHVEPFRGGWLPPRASVGPRSFLAGMHALAAGPARPVRVDLTATAQAAAGRPDRMLYVLVRQSGGDGVALASPWAVGDRVQPRLELMLH